MLNEDGSSGMAPLDNAETCLLPPVQARKLPVRACTACDILYSPADSRDSSYRISRNLDLTRDQTLIQFVKIGSTCRWKPPSTIPSPYVLFMLSSANSLPKHSFPRPRPDRSTMDPRAVDELANLLHGGAKLDVCHAHQRHGCVLCDMSDDDSEDEKPTSRLQDCDLPKCKGKQEGKMKTCGGCRNAWYCGVECQRAHWAEHKEVCQRTGKMIRVDVGRPPLERLVRGKRLSAKLDGGGLLPCVVVRFLPGRGPYADPMVPIDREQYPEYLKFGDFCRYELQFSTDGVQFDLCEEVHDPEAYEIEEPFNLEAYVFCVHSSAGYGSPSLAGASSPFFVLFQCVLTLHFFVCVIVESVQWPRPPKPSRSTSTSRILRLRVCIGVDMLLGCTQCHHLWMLFGALILLPRRRLLGMIFEREYKCVRHPVHADQFRTC